MIEITNCVNRLDFPIKILQTFTNKIYSLCKPLSLKEIPEQLKNLYPEALTPYVTQLFKNKIIKKSFKISESMRQLTLRKDTNINIAASSPNKKMVALGYGINNSNDPDKNGFCVYKINQNETIDENQSPQIIQQQRSVTHLEFSPNSKSIVVGCNASGGDNLFLFKIKDEVVIDTEKPQILKGHVTPITGVVFHPSGQAIVSVSDDDTILLRTIDSNGTIQQPSFLDSRGIKEIKNLCFNHEGTLLVCSGMKIGRGEGKAHYVLVWKFDNNGNLKSKDNIEHKISEMEQIWDISWLPQTDKCIIGGNRENRNKSGLIWCDMSEESLAINNIENCKKDYSLVKVSPDGTMIILGSNNDNIFDLFAIHNNDSI